MRVVVVGASGNVGTSVLEALGREPAVDSVLGLARRAPALRLPKVEWARADVVTSDLVPHFRGADCVVHLAWLIQPSRDQRLVRRVNVDGSARVFSAVADADVPALVYASSVGAYSPRPKQPPGDRPGSGSGLSPVSRVDESWPTGGIATNFYSRHKAEVERLLDRFEAEHPDVRVVRLRPGLIFKRDAASGVRRLFAGPFLPRLLLRRGLLVVPDIAGLRFQAVHSLDVGEAYRLAVVRDDARGAYNVAADPVLDPASLARILRAPRVPVPARLARAALAASYRLRLHPTPPGWLDLALGVPLLDTTRAREELGWTPAHGADEALLDLLGGLRESAGLDTPPLAPGTTGPLRIQELLTGVGARQSVPSAAARRGRPARRSAGARRRARSGALRRRLRPRPPPT